MRRLAEKSARRIIDRLFVQIKRHADVLADQRRSCWGIPLEPCSPPRRDMTEEFLRAENRLLLDLQEKRPLGQEGDEPLAINDVAGLKVILEEAQQHRLADLIAAMPDCEILEESVTAAATTPPNLIVRYRPPREEILARPLGKGLLGLMQARGHAPQERPGPFAAFVRSARRRSCWRSSSPSYQELLESEIGRCIHEDRIIEQRLYQPYRGPLARTSSACWSTSHLSRLEPARAGRTADQALEPLPPRLLRRDPQTALPHPRPADSFLNGGPAC